MPTVAYCSASICCTTRTKAAVSRRFSGVSRGLAAVKSSRATPGPCRGSTGPGAARPSNRAKEEENDTTGKRKPAGSVTSKLPLRQKIC